MWNKKKVVSVLAGFMLLTGITAQEVEACSGITLTAENGAVVYGRTMEWGTFDLDSRLNLIPRGHKFVGRTPEGLNGKEWKGKYGFVAFDAVGKELYFDGMNEEGLTMGTFYHPGYAEYQKYDKKNRSNSMQPTDLGAYILSNAKNIEEVKKIVMEVDVVEVVEDVLGFVPPVHYIVTDKSGKGIVIEFTKGKTTIHDNPLGIFTNAPNFDWHMTNLNNYLFLREGAIPNVELTDDVVLRATGGGSGMLGLPGDFTPVSRFVRLAAFSQTARTTEDGLDASKELFRILDNFNVPATASEGDNGNGKTEILSGTQWTTAWDTKEMKLYYHTQYDRRTKVLDLGAINFKTAEFKQFPIDNKEDDIKEVSF